MSKATVWIAYEDVEWEGIQTLLGVFGTAIQARRAVDSNDPPEGDAPWQGSQGTYWRDTHHRASYHVERFVIGKLRV